MTSYASDAMKKSQCGWNLIINEENMQSCWIDGENQDVHSQTCHMVCFYSQCLKNT